MPVATVSRADFVTAIKRRIGLAGNDPNWSHYRPEWVLGPNKSEDGETVRGLGYDAGLRSAVRNRLNSYVQSLDPNADPMPPLKADTTIKECVTTAADLVSDFIR